MQEKTMGMATDHLWVTPWAGVADLGKAGGRQGILGVSSGVDFDLSTTGHRLGFYAQGVRSNGYSSDKGGLRAFSIGASYSFR